MTDKAMGEWLEKKRREAVDIDEERALGELGKKQWEVTKARVTELVYDETEVEESDEDEDEDEDGDEDEEEGDTKTATVDAKTSLLEPIAGDVLAERHQEYATLSKASMHKAISEATGEKKEYLMKIAEVREATAKALGSVGKAKTKAAAEANTQKTKEKIKEKTKKRKADANVEELEKKTKGGSKASTKKSKVDPKVVAKKKAETKSQKQPANGERNDRAVKTGEKVLRSTRIANQKKK